LQTFHQKEIEMAINPGTTSTLYGAQPQPQPGIAQPQQPQQPQQPPRRTMSFMRMGAMGGLSRTPTSEALLKAITVLGEESKKLTQKPWEVSLIAVDNTKETMLAFSGIIFAVRRLDDPARGVAYHTLILEDSGEPIVARMDNFNNRQFEVQRLASDANDTIYYSTVANIMEKAYPNTPITPVSAEVVPRGFNWDDKDTVLALVRNAQLPGCTVLETMDPAFMNMDITAIDRDSTLNVRIAFNEPQRIDYCGLPVRNDIAITLSASSIKQTQQAQQLSNVNTQDRTVVISTIGGYIDPVFAPDTTNMYMGYPGQQRTPAFAANFIMTGMENLKATTIASQLLALVTVTSLRENNNWYPYYSPRPIIKQGGQNKTDLRDIGVINIEGNCVSGIQGGFDNYIDTKLGSFTAADLGQLLQRAFRPGMHFSLRVSECGADTWYNAAFLAASSGEVNAINAILTEANFLTGGIFSQFYGTNESPVLLNNNRVHLGYYINEDGVKRDISDIDYVAIMNLVGKNDPTTGARWANTFLKYDEPLVSRMSDRKKMIEQVLMSEITYTGFGRIVTFTSKFIDALSKSCAKAGLDMRTINPSITGDYFSQRAQADYLGQVQVMPGPTGLFNQGYNTYNNFAGPNLFVGRTF